MKRKIFRILGKNGRITIPFDMRKNIGFRYGDLLSFTEDKESDTVIIKREKFGNGGEIVSDAEKENIFVLLEFLDTLNEKQKRAALIHLSNNLVSRYGVKKNEG